MVSVIITTFGANELLIRAINSVLNQTYKDLEVIVVDDNNPGTFERLKTEKMMSRYSLDTRVKYIRHERNQNGAAARNTGIERANGSYLAFLDDDDLYLPKRVEVAVEILDRRRDLAGVCFGVVKVFKQQITSVETVETGHIMTIQDMLIGPAIGSGSNIFLRKNIVDTINGFDTEFRRKQDLEFIIRAMLTGKIMYDSRIMIVKDVSGVRRVSYNNNRSALIKFNIKFRNEINQLSSEQQEIYYKNQYRFLLQIAEESGNKAIIRQAVNELSEYDSSVASIDINKKAVMSKIRSGIKYGALSGLVNNVRIIKHKMRSHTFRAQIDEETYLEIAKTLKDWES